MTNSLQKIHSLGQSIWYDNIQRKLLENGELLNLIERGEIWGVTSNPSIFHNAIANSKDYDSALKPMAWSGMSSIEIYEQLVIEDIQNAADLFLPVYEESSHIDGYVSLEVNPLFSNETQKTIEEAKRLWKRVDRPNLMIKIPATKAGLPAIAKSIASGINVNVTLIFSLERYAEVIDAYMDGLEERLQQGQEIQNIASVASFFISRMDSKIDPILENLITENSYTSKKATYLLGKAAIANAKMAFDLFKDQFTAARFQRLRRKGAMIQRSLWASTSTKNSKYSDVLYVEELIGPDTINTIPPVTLEAFRKHGEARLTLDDDDDSHQVFKDLEELGISNGKVAEQLEIDGVNSFAEAFTALLATLEERRIAAAKELGTLQTTVKERLEIFGRENVAKRIHQMDPTLWSTNPKAIKEIQSRLGWLDAPVKGKQFLEEIQEFLKDCLTAGFTHALLLGMGGSSLAPEVIAFTFGVREGNGQVGLDMAVLDSTDPIQIKHAERRAVLEKTLFIVSSKSGTTSEVNALFAYFWDKATRSLGKKAGKNFIAITDPGTQLHVLAEEKGFRKVFLADPNVGGRFSALTLFGLVPAALMGINIDKLLDRALKMSLQCSPNFPAGRNPGLVLGAILGEAWQQGKDKLTLLSDPEISSFGSWLEQLVAESTGKDGKGIIPIDLEPPMDVSQYGSDRLFVYLRQSGAHQKFVQNLIKSGQPVFTIDIHDEYDLGTEFFRWEFATAIACIIPGINPFDQPDVQDNKTRTEKKITEYKSTAKLIEETPIWDKKIQIFSNSLPSISDHNSLFEVLEQFLKLVKPGDYVAINAFVPRNSRNLMRLQKLRTAIQKWSKAATTLGFGPRFLHSTGQLHKGGGANGVFLEITYEPTADLEIPQQGMSFKTLEKAQAIGDYEALVARNKKVLRIHLPDDKIEQILH